MRIRAQGKTITFDEKMEGPENTPMFNGVYTAPVGKYWNSSYNNKLDYQLSHLFLELERGATTGD